MAAEKDVDKVVADAFFPDRNSGVFIEVGAAKPDYLSISASFRALGWEIIAVEPNPEFCKLHEARGYKILQYACSDEDQDDVDFYVVNSHSADYMGGEVSFEGFSSLGIKGQYAELRETVKEKTSVGTIKVNVRRLDSLLANYAPEVREIDIVAVDVEGWELSVMRGLDIDRYQPKVVILENLFKSKDYVEFMRERGYTLWKRLEPNDVYVRSNLEASSKSLRARIYSVFGAGERL
jgi:FkbM family methyltransferase